jgi:hypothetical protein
MEALPLRKETIFEGYVVPHYEALLLEREPPFYLDTKFLGYKHLKEWFARAKLSFQPLKK